MSQALVQSSAVLNVSGGTSGNLTLNGVSDGNLLTASVVNISDNTHTISAADGKNTWQTAAENGVAATGATELLYAQNVAGGNTTVIFTATGTINFCAILREWSGSATSSVLAASDSLNQATTKTHQASAAGINPGVACICLVVGGHSSNGAPYAAGSGYTLQELDNFVIDQYKIFSAAPSNEIGAWTSTNYEQSTGVIAAFEAAAAAPARAGAFLDGGMGAMIAA